MDTQQQTPVIGRSILVSNVSPSATDKTISNFFSFCGKITKLYLKKENDCQSAVIEFETEAACRTALLLTNALIVDRPIVVSEYVPTQEGQSGDIGKETPKEEITTHNFQVPDEQRSKTSVVASLLAAGYILGKDTFHTAQQLDEKHGFSVKAQAALDNLKNKAQQIDQQYNISTTISSIDQQYHISQTMGAAAQIAMQEAQKLAVKASENPTIAKGISTISSTLNNVKEQFDKAVEEQQQKTGSFLQNTDISPSKETPQQPQQSQQVPQQQQQQQATPPPQSVQPQQNPSDQTSSQ